MESYSNNNAYNSYISSEDKENIFSNLHMPTKWDEECDAIQKYLKDKNAKTILEFHFLFCTREDIFNVSSIQTIEDISKLCCIFSLNTIEDISNLSIHDDIRRKYLSLPDIVNFSRIIQKCRIIEDHSYKVRDDMNSKAKELLYKYGLIEAYYISENLKLKTSQDIKNLSNVKINSLDIPKSELKKLVELRDALANKDTHKAFSIAQADKVIEYANKRHQIEREFWHARENKAIALHAATKSYMY